jgi:Ca2+-binding RTX toxin-like protein
MATINGTALNDFLVSGPGVADTILGLAGNDVVFVAALADHPVGEKIDGGTGYDRLWFGSTTATDILVLRSTDTGLEFIQVADGVGNWTGTIAVGIDASAVSTALTLFGNDGGNALTGTKAADFIAGGLGADTIVVGLGADRIVMSVVAADADDIDAGALADLNTLVLVGVAAIPVVIDLTSTVDQLSSIALAQKGFANIDASSVGNSGIVVTASSLKNVIIGSAQDDIFLFDAQATLGTDVVAGGGGTDVLRFTSVTAGQTLALTANVTVETAEIADAAGLTTGTVKLSLSAAAVGAAITLNGNDGDNALTGGKFNDTIDGNAGNDTLSGGLGNDVYVAGSQGDWSALDSINDAGGTNDRLVFTSTTANDTLTIGAGKLMGVEGVYIASIGFATTGTTALDVDGSALLTSMAFIGNDGANFLKGGKGNDTFTGHGGLDTIHGGLGADQVVFDVAAGLATVDAGAASEGNKL